ncbi:MAG: 16S rRNA methyltransferase [Methanobacteriota archaeon]|nr:MAG: 16S rRNA methyltransferase [Euryarchaeota archaeon]
MLTLVLADTELERVPVELQRHPSVRASARKRGRSPASILLESSLHHPALRKFPEGERRGRPDIAHIVLVVALDSILNLEGGLRIFVHTRNDEAIQFAPETRIPKNYTRFVGLMEDLFEKGEVPEENPLIRMDREVTLAQLLAKLGGEPWAFAEGGDPLDLRVGFPRHEENLIAVIGGFPHGGFRSPVSTLCKRVMSIHPKPLKAWTTAAEVLVAYRQAPAQPPREPITEVSDVAERGTAPRRARAPAPGTARPARARASRAAGRTRRTRPKGARPPGTA